jgi:hypothetical protein
MDTAPTNTRLLARPSFGFNPLFDRVFLHQGTFRCQPLLFYMTIQQDPFEPDRWWFAPLLYVGATVVIAAFVLACF